METTLGKIVISFIYEKAFAFCYNIRKEKT